MYPSIAGFIHYILLNVLKVKSYSTNPITTVQCFVQFVQVLAFITNAQMTSSNNLHGELYTHNILLYFHVKYFNLIGQETFPSEDKSHALQGDNI
jgi:hypothetical protein